MRHHTNLRPDSNQHNVLPGPMRFNGLVTIIVMAVIALATSTAGAQENRRPSCDPCKDLREMPPRESADCQSAKGALEGAAATGGVVLTVNGVSQGPQATMDYIGEMGCSAAMSAAKRLLDWPKDEQEKKAGNGSSASSGGSGRGTGSRPRVSQGVSNFNQFDSAVQYAEGFARGRPGEKMPSRVPGPIRAGVNVVGAAANYVDTAIDNTEAFAGAFTNVPDWIRDVLGPQLTEMIEGRGAAAQDGPAANDQPGWSPSIDTASPRSTPAGPDPSAPRPVPGSPPPPPLSNNAPPDGVPLPPLGDDATTPGGDGSPNDENNSGLASDDDAWGEGEQAQSEDEAVEAVRETLDRAIDEAQRSFDSDAEADLIEKRRLLDTLDRVLKSDGDPVMTPEQVQQALDDWSSLGRMRRASGENARSVDQATIDAELDEAFDAILNTAMDPRSPQLQPGQSDRHYHVPGIQTPLEDAQQHAERYGDLMPTLDHAGTVNNPSPDSFAQDAAQAALEKFLERTEDLEVKDGLISRLIGAEAAYTGANGKAILDTMTVIYDEINNKGNVVTISAHSEGTLVTKAATTLLDEYFPELDVANNVRVMTLGGAAEAGGWRVPVTHVYDERDPVAAIGPSDNRLPAVFDRDSEFRTHSVDGLIDHIGPEMWGQARVPVTVRGPGEIGRTSPMPVTREGRARVAEFISESRRAIDTQLDMLGAARWELVDGADRSGVDPLDAQFRDAMLELDARARDLLDRREAVDRFAQRNGIQ